VWKKNFFTVDRKQKKGIRRIFEESRFFQAALPG
jgi:hypothetical protein